MSSSNSRNGSLDRRAPRLDHRPAVQTECHRGMGARNPLWPVTRATTDALPPLRHSRRRQNTT